MTLGLIAEAVYWVVGEARVIALPRNFAQKSEKSDGNAREQRPDVRCQRSVITPLRRSRYGEGASAL